MRNNRLKDVLAAGGLPIGHMICEFGTRGIAKILESAGLDFVIIDMEHTGFGAERIADLIAWFKATSVTPFVRVPQPYYHFIARTMDAGAMGVMIPNVETAEVARSVVDSVKYAPRGKRGVILGAAHTDFVAPDPVEYFTEANSKTTVICQIESTVGLSNLDAIAATEGLDILWVGHGDLTQSMGIPGDFQNPAFLDAMRQVAEAGRNNGKAVGAQPGDAEQARQWLDLGFNVLSWSADMVLYKKALAADVAALRERL